jgi:hypothetical protein
MPDELLTDEKGVYRLNKHGSKERPAGENAWVLYVDDMSQSESDLRVAMAKELGDRMTAEKAARQARIDREAKIDALLAKSEEIDAVISDFKKVKA